MKKRVTLLLVIILIVGVGLFVIPKRKRIEIISNYLLRIVNNKELEVKYKFNREEINDKKSHTEETFNFINKESLKSIEFLKKLFNDIPYDFFEKRINEEGDYLISRSIIHYDNDERKKDYDLTYKIKIGY